MHTFKASCPLKKHEVTKILRKEINTEGTINLKKVLEETLNNCNGLRDEKPKEYSFKGVTIKISVHLCPVRNCFWGNF